jgi:hypothetical protein
MKEELDYAPPRLLLKFPIGLSKGSLARGRAATNMRLLPHIVYDTVDTPTRCIALANLPVAVGRAKEVHSTGALWHGRGRPGGLWCP